MKLFEQFVTESNFDSVTDYLNKKFGSISTKYSHSPGSLGFAKVLKRIEVKSVLNDLVKTLKLRPIKNKNWGTEDFSGQTHWSFSSDGTGIGNEMIVTISSKDGETVYNASVQTLKSYD